MSFNLHTEHCEEINASTSVSKLLSLRSLLTCIENIVKRLMHDMVLEEKFNQK